MIKHPDRFREAAPAGFDGVFEWDFLRGAFGEKIMPMDFDGVVERRGHFLVFETKAAGVPVPLGQKITLEALCGTNLFTVFVVYGKSVDDISSLDIWRGEARETHDPANHETVYERAAAWFQYANHHPYPRATQRAKWLIDELQQENSRLRAELREAGNKIEWLSGQIDSLREQFKLVPPPRKKQKRGLGQSSLFPTINP